MGQLTFYFDRCFGKRFPDWLERAKPPFSVEYQHNSRNRFPQDMPDDEWLSLCGKQGWVAFSHDGFRNLAVEMMAIKQHKVAAFALWGGQLPTWDKLCHFMRGYPKIMHVIRNEKPPYLYRLRSNGHLHRVDIA